MIKNAAGEGIVINELDKEAAAFWGHPEMPNEYARPHGPQDLDSSKSWEQNWFDGIGLYIHALHIGKKANVQVNWSNVVGIMTGHAVLSGIEKNLDMNERMRYFRPYVDLIIHWKNKGYVPIATND